MQILSGSLALVAGQQSYAVTFSPPFAVVPSSFLPSIFIPNSSGEIFAASADRSTLTATGVTVWLNAIPSADSAGGFLNWRATDAPTNYPSPTGQLAGSTALAAGSSYYDLSFPVPFGGQPTGIFATAQMPNSSGEVFTASPDLSTLTPRGVRVWLNGTPTAASNGGYVNWLAEGPPPRLLANVSRQNGRTVLVAGQQDYTVTFPSPYQVNPYSVTPSVMMPGSSGEVLQASVDYSTLTRAGCTIRLNGLPTSASEGGYIDWLVEGPESETVVDDGITAFQLLTRIGRRCRNGGDFTTLSMLEVADVLEAANTGLQRLYNALPPYFKEITEGFILQGPTNLSGVTVTQYSKTVAPNTFTKAQIGCTVRLDGDPQWNQVIGTSTLMNPYAGQSGAVNGIVYGDAIWSPSYPFDRIIGNPRFANQGYYPINPMSGMRSNGQPSWLWQQTVGTPMTWWVQTFGQSQGAQPFLALKFAPLPDQNYSVNVRMSLWPKRLTLQDYQNSTRIPVPPQFIETALIPMCIAAFMGSPAYEKRGDEKDVVQRSLDGETFLRLQPGQVGAPNNSIGTPLGY